MRSKSQYRVNIKLGNVEGAESGVVRIVEALSEMLRGPKRIGGAVDSPASSPVMPPAPRSTPIDIRSFFSEKQPSSDVEAAAVAAYYYQYLAPDAERRDSIDSTSLQQAFRLARRPLPAKTIYTLQNARGAGYLDSTGETGRFRLNPVGYNLVEHSLGPSLSSDEGRKSPSHRTRRK